MFKNGKENVDVNVDKEEKEKTYKYQTSLLNDKIQEQQKKLDKLIDIVSARFGDDVIESDVNKKIQDIEDNIKKIENDYKNHIEKNSETMDTKIKNQKEEFSKALDNAETKNTETYKKYFQILETNGKDIEDLKNALSEKQMFIENLYSQVDNFEKDDRIYKKYIQEEFEDTNNKINSINYSGITNKFEKMLKKKDEGLITDLAETKTMFNDKINELQNVLQKNSSELDVISKKILDDTVGMYTTLKTNEENTNKIDNKLNDHISFITKKSESIDEKIAKINENNSGVSNNITKIFKSIQKNEDEINNINTELKKSINSIKLLLKEKESQSNKIEQDKNKIYSLIKQNNDNISSYDNKLGTIDDSIKGINSTIDVFKTNISKELANKTLGMKNAIEKVNNNSKLSIKKITENVQLNNKNIVLKFRDHDNKLKSIKTDMNNFENALNKNYEQLKYEIQEKINENIGVKKEEQSKLEQANKEINEAIKNVNNKFNSSILNVENEITKLKESTELLKEKNNNSNDIESLKKEYSKYIGNVESSIEKMKKLISTTQEKNIQSNKDLQLKIKTYIDNKNSKMVSQFNETLSRLNMSILEKEKLQNAEFEKIIAKKLKTMQEENEKTINRKIQELNNAYRKNPNYFGVNSVNSISEPKKTTKPKKKIYETIDKNEVLKQSASSKKQIPATKEKKTKSLKFFYDEDDVN